ncbi:hypothetical protein [Tropicimonas sp. IMCC34043]|uniref:hypothetical protein n=1 Tax=Tropicimonas sp. IMCC34043 TaxID=2248760 RepID=UPI000E25B72A|nr:hypothetical protein [Tropicimonas sp. IMCC34043]
MPTAKGTPEYYATMATAKLFDNDALRGEFMNIYLQDPASAGQFLTDKVGIPTDVATAIVSKSGKELSDFVGDNICKYLW